MSFLNCLRCLRLPPFKKRTRRHQNDFKNHIVIPNCLRCPRLFLREYIFIGTDTPTPAGIHTKGVYIVNWGGIRGIGGNFSFSGHLNAFPEKNCLRAVFLGVTDFPAKLKIAGFLRDFCGRVAG